MAYEKTIWKDRVIEKPNTYRTVENPDGTVTLNPVPGQVIEKGTPVSANNLNKIEDELVNVNSQLDTITTELNSISINVKYPSKELNVAGLKGNSDENDITKLNQLITAIKGKYSNVKLYFPNDTYIFTGTVVIPKGFVIYGESRNSTIIKKGNFNGHLFHINKEGIVNSDRYYNFQLENMTLKGDNTYLEGGALFIENSLRVVIRNLLIENFNGNGITFYGSCFYPHLDSVFIHYCSSSPNARYSNGDTLPSVDNAGFNGNNLRCAVIDFAEGGLNNRSGDWTKASADLTTINCNFEANDVGVRWKSADSHVIGTVFQGNAMHELITETSMNLSECHVETNVFNNYKMSNDLILIKSNSLFLNNCNLWGNSATHANSAIKCEDCYYLNINGGRIIGFKYAIDSTTTSRLYSVGNDFVSKDSSAYVNGTFTKKIVVNHSVGGFELTDNLVFGSGSTFLGSIIPYQNISYDIGNSTNKIRSVYNSFNYADKIFLNNQVSIFYNSTDPNGVVTATKGSLCLTPLGMYVREGGNMSDTIWLKK